VPIAGPVIVIDDDSDDQEIFADVLNELGVPNELKFFHDGQDVINYLITTPDKPFVIISDVKLAGALNGLEVRKVIVKDDYLRRKSIPYVFLTSSVSKHILNQAYEMEVQGFFQKQSSYKAIKAQVKLIIEYWKLCEHPIL
jgi:CheY-like chemotaxis protein